jgi:hypothetical protein
MLVDPLLSLAISMHAQKGVYALLLGSGVSRSAKIPTGWEVILDLISRVATISGESHTGEAAAAWYRAKYGELNYSHLLNQLAATPAERQQLLRQYFEPTPEEAEQHLKVPTPAHHAVAELVRDGYVRVILTTNFDRLCERAIENEGLTPLVISSPDAAEGATPLAHSSCTVIKLHGDYLDTRLKNIQEELSTYDPRIDGILDRVLDEYGLIVCGWSAQWDNALREAFERRKSRRYSIYWIVRGGLTDEARQLVNLSQAREISCPEADIFFPSLAEKIAALNDFKISDPLPPKIASTTVKRYLVDDRHWIRLHDLINDLVRDAVQQFRPEHLLLMSEPSIEQALRRMKVYESETQVLQHVIVSLCKWGAADHESLVTKIIELQGYFSIPNGSYVIWSKMRLYPSLILLYAGGIAAIDSANYRMLRTLFTAPTYHDQSEQQLLFVEMIDRSVLPFDLHKDLPGYERRFTPLSDYLFNLLHSLFSETLSEYRYEQRFDYFEFIRGLVYADLGPKSGLFRVWGPPGRYAWKSQSHTIVEIIDEEILRLGGDWPLLKVGFFDGSLERLHTVLDGFKRTISAIRNDWHV